MTNENLTSESRIAEKTQNTAGVPSKIVEWEVPDSVVYALREGKPVILEVQAADGSTIPNDTDFAFGFTEPNDPLHIPEIFSDFDVAPFNALTLRDQQSGDNAQRRTLNFEDDVAPEGIIGVEEGDTIELWTDAEVEIDVEELYVEYPMEVRSR